jgi:neutral ceramidase
MTRILRWAGRTVILFALVLTARAPVPAAEDAGWSFGTARARITPAKLFWMAGFAARTRPAEGTLDDLWTKVLALRAPDGGQAVIVAADVLGFPKATYEAIVSRLGRLHGLDRSRILLAASHTHSGPVLRGALPDIYPLDDAQRALIEEYTRAFEDAVVGAVGEALSRSSPAVLTAGEGKASFAVNRRTNREGDLPEMLKRGESPRGPTDHSVPVLAVRAPDGSLRAVLLGYAAHTSALSGYLWSADYAGCAVRALESRYPGAQAMFFQGCGSDQSAAPRGTLERCRIMGEELAAAVAAALEGPMRPVAPRLRAAIELVPLEYERPSRAELEEAAAGGGYRARWAKRLLGVLDAGKTFPSVYPEYPVQVWKLGADQLLIALGGETCVDYSLLFKAKFGPTTWVAGYSNDAMAYIPSRRIREEGGYQAGAFDVYGLPASRWAAGIEDRIAAAAGRLVDAAGKPAVSSTPKDGDWFIPARLNYGTWAQKPKEDFPDGDIDARLGKMARIGMRDYFFYRDQEASFRRLSAAAENHGVRLWLRTFGQARYSEQDVREHPERLFQMDWTRAQRIACPSWPENGVEWVAWTEPFLREYRDHLHGVNLDFIRYPDDSPCSCAACRALYEKWLGRHEVTEEDLEDEDFVPKYSAMRGSVIGGMVRRVRAMCDRVGLKLSVCVFADLRHARLLGQDWPGWAREGWVDVVCPMSYTGDRALHGRWLREHLTAMEDEAELWDSVARKWDRGENSPEEVLAQSLEVLRGGAHGLASFNMAAFGEEDWRLQAALQKECGWNVSVRDGTLLVEGPPFAWMKLPPWPILRYVASGVELKARAEGDRVIARGACVWMEAPGAFPAASPGGLVKSRVAVHNGSAEDAAIRIKGRLPEGWRIEEPSDAPRLAAGESRAVDVAVRAPGSAPPGRYWVDIMAEDARSGRPVPRATGAVEVEVGGALFAVLPLTRTRFTSSPTCVSVEIVPN